MRIRHALAVHSTPDVSLVAILIAEPVCACLFHPRTSLSNHEAFAVARPERQESGRGVQGALGNQLSQRQRTRVAQLLYDWTSRASHRELLLVYASLSACFVPHHLFLLFAFATALCTHEISTVQPTMVGRDQPNPRFVSPYHQASQAGVTG
jgi:hypothetical protein